MKTLRNIGFALVMFSFVACGGNTASKDKTEKESKAKTEKTSETKKEKDQTTKAKKEEVELVLIAAGETMDKIHFDPKSLEVPAGAKVKLTFKNESSAAGMLHNFVLVESGSAKEIATAGIQAGPESEYVPEDDRVIAYTKVLDMGEEIVFEFEAPKEKGSYYYICTYPGHYPQMVGRLSVI